ncbi:MAG: hypothetical protein ACT4PV_05625 [Planctomycetaceae bacterium]
MLRLLILLLAAAPLCAGEDEPATPEETATVARLIGEGEWGQLPLWRQRMVLERYRRYRAMAPEKRDALKEGQLREMLLRAPRERADELVPRELREALAALPPEARPLAGRLVLMRWRQIQLDFALRRLPDLEERRATFLRLFPEPFDAAAAREAHEALRARTRGIVAWHVLALVQEAERKAGREFTEEERRAAAAEVVEKSAHEEERAAVDLIRAQLLQVRGGETRRIQADLERELYYLVEGPSVFLTPRERELVRYAFRPEDCPFLDPGIAALMGPAPTDPAERRAWERDSRGLARLDLLDRMSLPREMLLHLASCETPEDFFRALQAIRGVRPPRPRPGSGG